MRLIDADTAQAGMTIVSAEQTQGKGQRGKTWADVPGQSLLMSIITTPQRSLAEQTVFNAGVAAAIAGVLEHLSETWTVHIKWPNDIIINDKKAGGILIENVLRGSSWTYSIIGFGLNVKQSSFPAELPYATSLKIAGGRDYDVAMLRGELRTAILESVYMPEPVDKIMQQYNERLYKRGQPQMFVNGDDTWTATVIQANRNGTLQVQLEDGRITDYVHGHVLWGWK